MAHVCMFLLVMYATAARHHVTGQQGRDGADVDLFSLSKNFTVMVRSDFDVLLTVDQYKQLLNDSERVKRTRLGESSEYWPRGVVYYEITDGVKQYRTILKVAINHWQLYTCLRFKESTSATTRVKFVMARSCTSFSLHHGVMEVGIHPSCLTVRNIIHEIGHAVGLIHEHNRPDRDDYIKLRLDKITPRVRLYFNKYRVWDLKNNINVGYDYASIMHLSDSNDFLDTGSEMYEELVGKGQGLSFRDIKHIHYMYQCDNAAGCERQMCPFNGFVFYDALHGHPKCQCVCDSGLLNDPLRHCATILSEFPPPVPFHERMNPSHVLDMALESPCSDVQENCADLKVKGMCRIEIEAMYLECAKTCNFCNKGGDLCLDYDQGCHMMVTSGACTDEVLNETMGKICPKSCGRCVNTRSPCNVEQLILEPGRSGHLQKPTLTHTLTMLAIGAVFRNRS